jgi:pyruvate/2-oxoacid:ferredoxin oxidoreductase alpha subunit
MVIGAARGTARAPSPATSGPGLSLMQEFLGLAYYTEIPVVLWDVQRVGPSTGMPTRTQQCDLMSAAYASHGDTRHVCLYPADPKECFEFAPLAFDLAERLQTPVFMLTDLDIGMNDWVVPRFKLGRRLQARSRPRAQPRGDREDAASTTATPPRTSSAWQRARCPAYPERARSSRAARATTSSASTPRSRTSTPR